MTDDEPPNAQQCSEWMNEFLGISIDYSMMSDEDIVLLAGKLADADVMLSLYITNIPETLADKHIAALVKKVGGESVGGVAEYFAEKKPLRTLLQDGPLRKALWDLRDTLNE